MSQDNLAAGIRLAITGVGPNTITLVQKLHIPTTPSLTQYTGALSVYIHRLSYEVRYRKNL